MTVDPYDDDSISNEHLVIRRIDPARHIVPDENRGGRRVSTKAFCESSEGSRGMSIDIKSDIENADIDPKEYVKSPKYTAAVEFRAEAPRSVDLVVGKEPEEFNPYHGEVWRLGESRRFKTSQKKALLNAASWLNEIQDVYLGS